MEKIIFGGKMRKSILGATILGTFVLGTGAEVSFYDESLPHTLNPLFAETMVDNRAQELYFDRLYYNDPIDNSLTSRLVNDAQTQLEDAGKSLRLTINPNIRWHNGKKFLLLKISVLRLMQC
jgi:ABC-type transport system substrate-binding protein